MSIIYVMGVLVAGAILVGGFWPDPKPYGFTTKSPEPTKIKEET